MGSGHGVRALSRRRTRDGTRSSGHANAVADASVRYGGSCCLRTRDRSWGMDVDARTGSTHISHWRPSTIYGDAVRSAAGEWVSVGSTTAASPIDIADADWLRAGTIRARGTRE